jgi:predicted Zn-dependent protease
VGPPPAGSAGTSRGRPRRLWRALAAAALLVAAGAGLAPALPQLRAWHHFRAARTELQRYHNPQALRHLQACLRVWRDDPDVQLLAARAARRAGRYDEADRFLEHYQRARGLEAVAFERLLLAAERSGDEVTMGLCRRHLEQGHPDAPLLFEALTRGYLRQYRLREARGCLGRWLEAQPDNPQALCLQGQLYLDYEQVRSAAVDCYRRAVEVDPDHEEARLGLAVALLESRKYAEAAEQLEEVRRRQPDNLRVRVGLAECRDMLGDPQGAERQVREVLDGHPDYPQALALLGRLQMEAGRFAEAEASLRRALAGNPADVRARHNLAQCLRHNGKEEEARAEGRKLQQREDDLKRFHEIVTRELAQRPHDPALHCTLGELLLRSGYRAEGLRWLDSALRKDPQYEPARKALAEYSQKAQPRKPAE